MPESYIVFSANNRIVPDRESQQKPDFIKHLGSIKIEFWRIQDVENVASEPWKYEKNHRVVLEKDLDGQKCSHTIQ